MGKLTNILKQFYIFLIITSQILTVFLLIVKINQKKQEKVLGTYAIDPINKENITFSNTSSLKYFYEPKANTIEKENAKWLPYEVVYTYNSDSLNERFDYVLEKPENTFRIIAIGDSFTFGSFVDTKNSYPEQLENKLNGGCKVYGNFEVINLGVGAYDLRYTIERFLKRGIKYKPDLILWLINHWNFSRINEKLLQSVAEITDEASKSGNLEKREKEEGIYFAWTQAEGELAEKKLDLESIQYPLFTELRNSYKGKILLIVFKDHLEGVPRFKEFIDKVENNDKNIIIFSDLSTSELETLKLDPHPNARDYNYISSRINEFLIKNQITPCY